MTLRDKQRLLSFENRIFQVICGPITEFKRGRWRRSSVREERMPTKQSHTISVMRSRKPAWTGHRVRAVRRIHEGLSLGIRPRGRPGQRWRDNVETDLAQHRALSNWTQNAPHRKRLGRIRQETKALETLFSHRI